MPSKSILDLIRVRTHCQKAVSGLFDHWTGSLRVNPDEFRETPPLTWRCDGGCRSRLSWGRRAVGWRWRWARSSASSSSASVKAAFRRKASMSTSVPWSCRWSLRWVDLRKVFLLFRNESFLFCLVVVKDLCSTDNWLDLNEKISKNALGLKKKNKQKQKEKEIIN